jgi:hypothetical protein
MRFDLTRLRNFAVKYMTFKHIFVELGAFGSELSGAME